MKNIAIIIGTRPEAIKMAPLYRMMKTDKMLNPTLISTGQHKEMLLSVSQDFDIQFDVDMSLMSQNQSLAGFVSILIRNLDDFLSRNKFDLILVHGDTITSTIVAMVAFWNKIKIGHVEAGLRTYNLNSPFPEEANRQLTSRISNINFCPSHQSLINLESEKLNTKYNFITGNTVIDSLIFMCDKINNDNLFKSSIIEKLDKSIFSNRIVLITGHRRENFGIKFQEFAESLIELSAVYPNVNFVYPLHLNPNVRNVFSKKCFDIPNIFLIEPLDYKSFVFLMMQSYLILTDSGGVQEEAPALGKPVLVMRDTTERPEAIEAGCCKLIGMTKNSIISHVSLLLDSKDEYLKMSNVKNPYGDGTASEKIIEHLKIYLYNDNS
jgi:UDP-N-acetylglucosamine 2-epimerase (non-hydrolysing)